MFHFIYTIWKSSPLHKLSTAFVLQTPEYCCVSQKHSFQRLVALRNVLQWHPIARLWANSAPSANLIEKKTINQKGSNINIHNRYDNYSLCTSRAWAALRSCALLRSSSSILLRKVTVSNGDTSTKLELLRRKLISQLEACWIRVLFSPS